MEYEVEIRVKASGSNSDTLHTLRETWSFGHNPKWFIAGQAYVVEETAKSMIQRINDQMNGSTNSVPLDDVSGRPTRK